MLLLYSTPLSETSFPGPNKSGGNAVPQNRYFRSSVATSDSKLSNVSSPEKGVTPSARTGA